MINFRKLIEFPWVIFTCALIGLVIFFYDFPLDITRSSAEISNNVIGSLYDAISIGMRKEHAEKIVSDIDKPKQFKVLKKQGVTYIVAPWNFHNSGGGLTLRINYCDDLVIGVHVTEKDTGKNPDGLYQGKEFGASSCK